MSGDFDTSLFNFVSAPGHEGVRYNSYLDSVGIPTIGVGYALLTRNAKGVYSVPTSQLKTDFGGIHTFTQSELLLLSTIATDLNKGDQTAARAAFNTRGANLSFTLTPAQALTLFTEANARTVAAASLSTLAQSSNFKNTYELIALEDIAYQGPALLKSILPAVQAGNRPLAWFDILTTINGGASASASIELRREDEAAEFGLYSQGDKPSMTDGGAEAISVDRFLGINGKALVKYLEARGSTASNAQNFLSESYDPAVSELIRVFGAGYAFDSVYVSSDDKSDKVNLTGQPTGPILMVTGLGNDTITDKTTVSRNNLISIRGQNDKVTGGTPGDLSDLLYFGGHAIGENLTLNTSNEAIDPFGRKFTYSKATDTVTISANGAGHLTISNFSQDDFGLTFTKTFKTLITFSEFAVGTPITDQYKSKGIIFGGNSPFITTDSSNPTSPVLSGSPRFNGTITGTFVNPTTGRLATVNEFALDAGYFDNLGSTELSWYDSKGKLIGTALDSIIGIQHFDIASTIPIASWKINEIGIEQAGYAIDNVSFDISGESPAGASSQVFVQGMAGMSSAADAATSLALNASSAGSKALLSRMVVFDPAPHL